jgi:hypothetical protein
MKTALINTSTTRNYYNQLFPENHFDPHLPGPAIAIVDTGCTGHFIRPDIPHSKPTPMSAGLQVTLPNKTIMTATHTCKLYLPMIPEAAREAHIFPKLAHPLVSIGTLCDHGCQAVFTAAKQSSPPPRSSFLTLIRSY